MLVELEPIQLQLMSLLDDQQIEKEERNYNTATTIAQYGLIPAIAQMMDPTGMSAAVVQSLLDNGDNSGVTEIENTLITQLIFDQIRTFR